jgi:voltage-gated potassium channel
MQRKPDAGLGVLLSLAAASALEPSYQGLKRSLRQAVSDDPIDAAVITVLGGSYLFYVAEKGQNPKVKTYFDALVFISTCLSVGYADIFARTPAGQAIASALMTFGPALTNAFLAAPSAEKQPGDPRLLEVQQKIAGTLEAILTEMRSAAPPQTR